MIHALQAPLLVLALTSAPEALLQGEELLGESRFQCQQSADCALVSNLEPPRSRDSCCDPCRTATIAVRKEFAAQIRARWKAECPADPCRGRREVPCAEQLPYHAACVNQRCQARSPLDEQRERERQEDERARIPFEPPACRLDADCALVSDLTPPRNTDACCTPCQFPRGAATKIVSRPEWKPRVPGREAPVFCGYLRPLAALETKDRVEFWNATTAATAVGVDPDGAQAVVALGDDTLAVVE